MNDKQNFKNQSIEFDRINRQDHATRRIKTLEDCKQDTQKNDKQAAIKEAKQDRSIQWSDRIVMFLHT